MAKSILSFDARFSNLVKINESLNIGAFNNYKKTGLTYVDVPEMVGITGACENVDTLFKIKNRVDLPLFFTQTGQLSLEQALQNLAGVFTVIHSGRDEEEEDERHLRQFRLTEEEFDCTMVGMKRANYDEEKMFFALLKHIQSTIQAMIAQVLKDNSTSLKKYFKRNTDKLLQAVAKDFYQVSYDQAVKLLNKNGYPQVKFGDDLKAHHEAKIVLLLNKKDEEIPVFITRYPKEIKFFNMKVSAKDPRVVLSADLIFPFSGEGTGSAVREHDFEKLNKRLMISTMYKLHLQRGGKYEDFKWYLDIIKAKKSNPHAGCGIGNERVIQYILGEKDIRKASIFSLLSSQTGDWDKSKYGTGSIVVSSPQKHILLIIGEMKNKKYLLSYIKNLGKKSNCIFYATEKTHSFFKKEKVNTSLVYKISQMGKTPNISDLLQRKVFDIIINIPSREMTEKKDSFTDGKLIRKGALAMGTTLITDSEVAGMVLENLKEKNN
jgi:asparaginyl-tRNA synthetase